MHRRRVFTASEALAMLLDDESDDDWLFGQGEGQRQDEQTDDRERIEIGTSARLTGGDQREESSSDDEGHFLELDVETGPLAHAFLDLQLEDDSNGHSSQEEGDQCTTLEVFRCGYNRDCFKLFPKEAVEANRLMVLDLEKSQKEN